MERHCYLETAGCRMLGAIHEPDDVASRLPLALVYLHGWAGYRIGPHQMFVKMARRAEALGFTSLRFDFRGRGDSEGATSDATLTTMIEDAVTATEFVAQETGIARVALIGDCSGSEVAIGAGPLHPAISAQVLWSAPIVAGDRARTDRAKQRNVISQYAAKVLRRETWTKLARGRLQTEQILKVLRGGGKGAGEAGAASDQGLDWLQRFSAFHGPRLFVYGGNDPTTDGCVAHYEALCQEVGQEFRLQTIEGANHAFYSLAWEDEVIETSLTWLRQQALSEAPGHAAP
jgi:pimeloyl-ACP methyl ester carboxylesterase